MHPKIYPLGTTIHLYYTINFLKVDRVIVRRADVGIKKSEDRMSPKDKFPSEKGSSERTWP